MYRWLLRLYPVSFRNEYGREMATVFARERRDTRTAPGMAALWLRVIADTCVNAARIHWDILRQDLRYTLRTLRRTPAFAVTAVTVVALGIGATTAAFSLADFVLIRPLPFSGGRSSGAVLGGASGLSAHGARAGQLPRPETDGDLVRSSRRLSRALGESGRRAAAAPSAGGGHDRRRARRAGRAPDDGPAVHGGRRRRWRASDGTL